eukprot:CCRYP_014630-RA/>CCRYP_014630-RA protein AED:0.53 eAED:0.64 QI:0/0/0/1/0/0/2/0/66
MHWPLASPTPSHHYTLILDSKCGVHSTSARYCVPRPTHIREHLQASLECNTEARQINMIVISKSVI